MSEGARKRKHVRLAAMGPVEVFAQGRLPQEGYLASIGRGGLGLYLSEPVNPMQLVLVSLRLAAEVGDAEDLKVAARVRWVGGAGRLSMAGLAFEKMSDSRYERLLRHLNLIEAWQLGERGESKMRFSVRE